LKADNKRLLNNNHSSENNNNLKKIIKKHSEKYKLEKDQIILESSTSNEMDIDSSCLKKNQKTKQITDFDINISDESSSFGNNINTKNEKVENSNFNNNTSKNFKNCLKSSDTNKTSTSSLININAEKSNKNANANNLHKKELDEKVNNFNQKFFDYKNFNNNKANLTNTNLNATGYAGAAANNERYNNQTAPLRDLKDEEGFTSNAIGVKKAKRNWIKKDQNSDSGLNQNNIFKEDVEANKISDSSLKNLNDFEAFKKNINENLRQNKNLLSNSEATTEQLPLDVGIINEKSIIIFNAKEPQREFKFISNMNSTMNAPIKFIKNSNSIDSNSNNNLNQNGNFKAHFNQENDFATKESENKPNPFLLPMNNTNTNFGNKSIITNNNILMSEDKDIYTMTQNSLMNPLEFETDLISGKVDILNNFAGAKKENKNFEENNKSADLKENMNLNNNNTYNKANDIDFDMLENELEDNENNNRNISVIANKSHDVSYELNFHSLENNFDEFYGMKISSNKNKLRDNMNKCNEDRDSKVNNKLKKAYRFSDLNTNNDYNNNNSNNNFKRIDKNFVNINLNNSNQDLLGS